MRSFAILVAAIVAVAVAEIAVPGRALYHAGWFNVLLIAFAALLGDSMRPLVRSHNGRARSGIIAVGLGAFLMAFATVVSGLFAPDTRTVIGAPGSEVPLSELGGALFFPVGRDLPVAFGQLGLSAPIGSWRYVGSSILQAVPRTVVGVEARDTHGGTLTITQPSGGAFLSPVLLMQTEQTIAGIAHPYDSFSVPALHRIVHVIAFSAREAAQLRASAQPGESPNIPATPAVLFAVDDDNDRPLPHAIALAWNGLDVAVGGVLLRGTVFAYPAVQVTAVPSLPVMVIGALALIAGLIVMARYSKPTLAPDATP